MGALLVRKHPVAAFNPLARLLTFVLMRALRRVETAVRMKTVRWAGARCVRVYACACGCVPSPACAAAGGREGGHA
ncbi:hypothetical protein EON67_01905 [archaeon]|nr:MAG: hypothetical protein EON67_01905 [archaeon]